MARICNLPGIEVRTTLSAFPASVGAARRFVRDVLHSRSIGRDVQDTVELLTSELVTNALVHAWSAPSLMVNVHDAKVRVEVSDGDAAPPTRMYPSFESTHGRGITIVDALASGWGFEAIPDDGKRVWFEVAL